MDGDPTIRVLGEIRDLQRQLLESHQKALRNQEDAIRAQSEAIARGRKLQVGLGLAIAGVLVIVLILLATVLRFYFIR